MTCLGAEGGLSTAFRGGRAPMWTNLPEICPEKLSRYAAVCGTASCTADAPITARRLPITHIFHEHRASLSLPKAELCLSCSPPPVAAHTLFRQEKRCSLCTLT